MYVFIKNPILGVSGKCGLVDSAKNMEFRILRLIIITCRKFIAVGRCWKCLYVPLTQSFPAQRDPLQLRNSTSTYVTLLLIDINTCEQQRNAPRRHAASTDTQPAVTVIDDSSDSCDEADTRNSEDSHALISIRSRVTQTCCFLPTGDLSVPENFESVV